MTTNEIRNLIEKKLVGQGSMIDVGGVLPAVLLNLLDLIEEGGGGTSDAVQYIPQELTSPQQMQARKNQGLYYEEETLAGVISWDGNTEGKESIDLGGILAYKVANTPKDIPQDAWLGYTSTEDLETTPFTQIVDYGQLAGAEGKMLMGAASGGGVVIVADQFSIDAQGLTIEADGIYFTLNVRSFSYDAYDGEIHHIEPKYIKDMYYEEEGVKTIDYSLSGDLEGYYRKVSDEVIEASAVIGHKFTSYSSDNGSTEYTITEDMVIAADSTHPTRILFDSSDPNSWAILIFPEDMEFEEDSFSKGVWFGDGGTISHPSHIESLEYDGVTVHQIPAKYIPDMPSGGLEYYEIELTDWTPLQLVSAELVGYSWEDITNALYAGKLLVFTIHNRNFEGNDVNVKVIGGQLSRMDDIEGGEYGMPCVRFPAAYSYLYQGSAGQFNRTVVRDIVIYPDFTQGGDEPVTMVKTEDSFTNQ